MTEPTTPRLLRKLSPPYPICNLQTAIEKTHRFFTAFRRNAVDKATAIPSLGHATNSRGQRVLATAIAYGLLEEHPGGKTSQVKISALGLRILRKEGDAAQQAADVRESALKPPIYGDMVRQWPEELPNDAAITRYLEAGRGYNPSSIAPLIRDFRATCEFAGLGKGVDLVEEAQAQQEETGSTAAPEAEDVPETPTEDAVTPLQSENSPEAPPEGKATTLPLAEQETEWFVIPLLAGRRLVVRYPKVLAESEVQMLDSAFAMIRDSIGAA